MPKQNIREKNALRDAAIIELLFATGIRISELCSLGIKDVNLYDRTVLIYGKGSKERKVQIGNDDVANILQEYKISYLPQIHNCNHFFANQNGTTLSDQSVRRMINKYTSLAAIELHTLHTCSGTLLPQAFWKQMLTYDIFRKFWGIVPSILQKSIRTLLCQSKEIFSPQSIPGRISELIIDYDG